MNEFNLYNDIQARTHGEIYLGVVGPVRTGKSTFIKRFMDVCILPMMNDEGARQRANDELPQSAAGRTIMTTEPKFVPNEAVEVSIAEGLSIRVRLIDCVGFMVDQAFGHKEGEYDRMVRTPWFKEAIPFTRAAEVGTNKVISEHSTIGIVVTCDGSFGEIDRSAFIPAEERTINELKSIGKPYVVLLNSLHPHSDETAALAEELSARHGTTVIPVNCDQLKKSDVTRILEAALYEFPITRFSLFTPAWMEMLENSHPLKQELAAALREVLTIGSTMKDVRSASVSYSSDRVASLGITEINTSNGEIRLEADIRPSVYYDTISELTGAAISNELELVNTIRELSSKRKSCEYISSALNDVEHAGFGVVTPPRSDIELEEPSIIKNGNRYGVRIKAKAPAVNLLKTNISIEIAPIVGSKQQAEDLIEYIRENSHNDPEGIWDTNIFGKTIEQIVEDGITEKTRNITAESMGKISDTLEKVMNENSGLVCLIV